jgi:CHAD domain-containing protein
VSFKLRPEESVGHAVRRLVRKQIDQAVGQLTGQSRGPRIEAVHDARKRFKKVRAVLRLVRDELGRAVFDRENHCFRDAGRPLSAVRDAQVLVDTVDKLRDHFKDEVPHEVFSPAREALKVRQKAVVKRVLDGENAAAAVSATAQEARERVADWADVPNRWAVLRAGLRRVYRQGRSAYRSACSAPRVEVLHEWRKRVKDLWHQLQVLRPLWPENLEALANEAHHLGDLLGDDHDLAVLHDLLTEEPPLGVDPEGMQALLDLIDRRRAELQQAAVALGRRLYAERPKAFLRRLGAYWHAWRSEKAAPFNGEVPQDHAGNDKRAPAGASAARDGKR